LSAKFYSNVSEVKAYTGIEPKDLGLADDDQAGLDAIIKKALIEIKDIIDTYCRRDFSGEHKVPGGIHKIAKEMASDGISLAMMRRDSPIVRVDDFTIKQVQAEILTRPVKEVLAIYRKKPSIKMVVVKGKM